MKDEIKKRGDGLPGLPRMPGGEVGIVIEIFVIKDSEEGHSEEQDRGDLQVPVLLHLGLQVQLREREGEVNAA